MKWFPLFLLVFLLSCNVTPEPMRYGTDLCYTCKMTIMEKGYASQIVSKKGRVYKFDDLGCMIQMMKSGALDRSELAHILTIKYGTDQDLMEVGQAVYATGDKIKSPMNFNIAAFAKKEEIPSVLQDSSLHIYSWNEIYDLVGNN